MNFCVLDLTAGLQTEVYEFAKSHQVAVPSSSVYLRFQSKIEMDPMKSQRCGAQTPLLNFAVGSKLALAEGYPGHSGLQLEERGRGPLLAPQALMEFMGWHFEDIVVLLVRALTLGERYRIRPLLARGGWQTFIMHFYGLIKGFFFTLRCISIGAQEAFIKGWSGWHSSDTFPSLP
ncbi:hypothetical protein Y1Q_0000242 [Alligator mississippiensis]|uniref:Uncharacterized protein n=1 Tax=Alligator mississippiensis TaxID=8496 RepID=A0A151P0Y7_ALLMI|nr:hypothetical protein Y1Q_0000242 [Alligator mississippiensis]